MIFRLIMTYTFEYNDINANLNLAILRPHLNLLRKMEKKVKNILKINVIT